MVFFLLKLQLELEVQEEKEKTVSPFSRREKRNFKCHFPMLRRENVSSYFSRGEREIFPDILLLKKGF